MYIHMFINILFQFLMGYIIKKISFFDDISRLSQIPLNKNASVTILLHMT
jgi:hypothetical protein